MERSIDQALIDWGKRTNNRKPILFSGARQVGKSYTIRHFGTINFDAICEINFERNQEFIKLFEQNFDTKRIINELDLLLNVDLKSGRTLLFFDEIQACAKALMSLRYFYEEQVHIPVIAAGSLLDFQFKNIPFPVGRVEHLIMRPMSFKEFLWAMNKKNLVAYIEQTKDLSPTIEQQIYDHLDTYFFVGGMPEAVKEFAASENFKAVAKIHSELLFSFQQDFKKYSPIVNTDCLMDILKSVPNSIGNQSVYTKLSNRFTSPTIKKGVEVLCTAHLLSRVNNVSIAGLPLTSSGKQFKLLFLDIGLITHLSGLNISDKILKTHLLNTFTGLLAEQFIGQELLLKHALYYWARSEPGTNAEVDYIIQKEGQIIPIEVKAGSSGSLKSLHWLLQKYDHISQSIVYSKAQEGEAGKIKYSAMYRVGI